MIFNQKNNFQQTLKNGRLGESEISFWLRQKGWNVLPAYEIEISEGKGPRLYSANMGELITPDLLIFKEAEIYWIEAKTKKAFTWYRIGNCWQDGIDSRHWEDYCKIVLLTKWPVWLFFLHRPGGLAKDTPKGKYPPTGLWGQEIKILKEIIDHESDRYAKGMVYWNLESFIKLDNWPLKSGPNGK